MGQKAAAHRHEEHRAGRCERLQHIVQELDDKRRREAGERVVEYKGDAEHVVVLKEHVDREGRAPVARVDKERQGGEDDPPHVQDHVLEVDRVPIALHYLLGVHAGKGREEGVQRLENISNQGGGEDGASVPAGLELAHKGPGCEDAEHPPLYRRYVGLHDNPEEHSRCEDLHVVEKLEGCWAQGLDDQEIEVICYKVEERGNGRRPHFVGGDLQLDLLSADQHLVEEHGAGHHHLAKLRKERDCESVIVERAFPCVIPRSVGEDCG
mmetsp:Transcript_49938/g.159820  ORF Transcript_49938/g.159820 Transcript_49938/m.159820 type:complete len:267 (-) Transcript_49938:84-884(-)